MAMALDETTPGDPHNALFLAQACGLAYFDEPAAAVAFREQLGLEAQLISVDNTQVYVAQNDRAIVVAFRGSQAPTTLDGLKDWLLTNANNYLILPEGRIGTDFAAAGVGARFHRGFMEALHAIWEPLLKKVTEAVETADRPLWVTGHSLGGALALLAAWRLQRSFVTVHEVVTFGAPMIGNDAAARAFEQEFAGKIFRYVNLEDPVPLLPSVSLVANSYAHCQSEVSMKAVQAAVSALEELKQTAGSAVDRVIEATQIDLLWKAVQGRIAAHFIDHYQERVKEKCGPEVPPTVAAEGADEPAEAPRAGADFRTSCQPSGFARCRSGSVARGGGRAAVAFFLGHEGPESHLPDVQRRRTGVEGLVLRRVLAFELLEGLLAGPVVEGQVTIGHRDVAEQARASVVGAPAEEFGPASRTGRRPARIRPPGPARRRTAR